MSKRTCEITSRTEEVRNVDAVLEELLHTENVEPEEAYAARLAVTEALNNVIEHAYEECEGHPISVSQSLEGDSLTVAIHDWGNPTPDGTLGPRSLPTFDMDDPESFPEGGWGLFLIQSHMDSVEYARDGERNTLTLTKKITRVYSMEDAKAS